MFLVDIVETSAVAVGILRTNSLRYETNSLRYETNSLRYETNVKNGVTGVEFDRKDVEMNKLLVSTLESKFRVYDLRTQHVEDGFANLSEKAHKSTVWLGKHLPQNRDIFMTGGGNEVLTSTSTITPRSGPPICCGFAICVNLFACNNYLYISV